jgi:site-specific DNA-adenine methylase
MKNHFFTSYTGNKREEVENIYKLIDFKNINTIVEPFCGSCALSFYIWTLQKQKNYTYIFNDLNNNLINFLQLIKDNKGDLINEEINYFIDYINILLLNDDEKKTKSKIFYNNYIKDGLTEEKNLIWNAGAFYIGHKYYTIRPKLYPQELKQFKNINIKLSPFYDFLTTANIEFYNIEGIKILEKYNKKNCFIFLDPPYIASCNNFYKTDTTDNTNNIYEFLTTYGLKNLNCKTIMTHENSWLFKILFKEYLNTGGGEYKKIYQSKKKLTSHITILNYILK